MAAATYVAAPARFRLKRDHTADDGRAIYADNGVAKGELDDKNLRRIVEVFPCRLRQRVRARGGRVEFER
ncbi:hypothetical protein NECAME_07427 [Necator americanus]|uniref:Uncharacterized protein n=1 Tax=Necator americanus TaxID=51031 RepID=W2TQG9_NECAM|nr:hypothetical protein NECAME_07427 [Necator americanus]ETN83366.1 hypothetical protein NECAME_07427 [Necator americanus]